MTTASSRSIERQPSPSPDTAPLPARNAVARCGSGTLLRSTDSVYGLVMPMKVGVARETAAGERRVALVPEALGKLTAAGLEILVESGAGAGSAIPDQAFVDAGATVVSTDDLYAQSDVVLRVQKPSPAEIGKLRKGQAVVGFLQPLIDP